MSNSEFFNMMVSAGEAGEDVIMKQLPIACKCWRGVGMVGRGRRVPLEFDMCYQPPKLIDRRKDKAFQKVLDIDIQLHYKCGGCPVFDALEWGHGDAEKDEWHEIKTNYETHGQSASGGNSERTQNIAIETVENKYWKKNHIGEEPRRIETDPRNGKEVYVNNGAGWFNKTTTKDKKRILADWYHFYQPIDADDFSNSLTVERATQKEIDRWLNDDAVPEGSTLIIQYPFSYCISIKGEYLEKIATARTEIDKEWGGTVKPRYEDRDIGTKQKGKLIPVADILPCLVYRRGADLKKAEGTGEWFKNGQEDLLTFIAGDSIIQKPFSLASGQGQKPKRYIVRRIYENRNDTYEPQRVSINADGKEITLAEGTGIEAVIVRPQQEKHREKQDEAQKKYWTDKYSDLYLMPEPLEMMAATAEKY